MAARGAVLTTRSALPDRIVRCPIGSLESAFAVEPRDHAGREERGRGALTLDESRGGTSSVCPSDATTFGSSAARSRGPVALRPSLAAGLPLSRHLPSPAVYLGTRIEANGAGEISPDHARIRRAGKSFPGAEEAARSRRAAQRAVHRQHAVEDRRELLEHDHVRPVARRVIRIRMHLEEETVHLA